MKKRTICLVFALLAIGCGGTSSSTRAPASVTDDGINYPRTFTATATVKNELTGMDEAAVDFDAKAPDDVFGCSEGQGGAEFVFFMKHGMESLKVDIGKPYFRESKSTYDDLIDVTLAGSVANLTFDRDQKSYQLQGCVAEVNRAGSVLSGVFHCDGVVGSGASNDPHQLELRFRCDIVPR